MGRWLEALRIAGEREGMRRRSVKALWEVKRRLMERDSLGLGMSFEMFSLESAMKVSFKEECFPSKSISHTQTDRQVVCLWGQSIIVC